MTPDAALQAMTEDLSAMQEGAQATFPAELFEAAFSTPASEASKRAGFTKPTILAETGFRMKYPGWGCERTIRTYTVTKPRRNPYAAQHRNAL